MPSLKYHEPEATDNTDKGNAFLHKQRLVGHTPRSLQRGQQRMLGPMKLIDGLKYLFDTVISLLRFVFNHRGIR